MHFRALAAVEVPNLPEDEITNSEIQKKIASIQKNPEASDNKVISAFYLGWLKARITTFARTVCEKVGELMEPYWTDTENEDYLEFDDQTEMLKSDFSQSLDCLRLPDGKLVPLNMYPYYNKYCLVKGKVYEKNWGPLHHPKRSKQAKKISVVPDYPIAKLFKSFKEYAEDYRGYPFNEENQAYGYCCNPNAMWDWFEIGGRWPAAFLVKNDCREYSLGERSWCNADSDLDAPKGYIWVAAARKKDICWDAMRNWYIRKDTEKHDRLERMFREGKLEEGFYGKIVDDGIVGWNEYYYRKNESLQEYLERCSLATLGKYPFLAHDIVAEDDWFSKEDTFLNDEIGKYVPVDWNSQLEDFIEDQDDETVLVGIDYHI